MASGLRGSVCSHYNNTTKNDREQWCFTQQQLLWKQSYYMLFWDATEMPFLSIWISSCSVSHHALSCVSLSEAWSSPAATGTRPPPCAHFSFTKINDHCAVMFGGSTQSEESATNDVYMLDLASMVSQLLARCMEF